MCLQQLKNLSGGAKMALALAPTTIALVLAYIKHLETQKLHAEVAASKRELARHAESHGSEMESMKLCSQTNAREKLELQKELASMQKKLRAAEEREEEKQQKAAEEKIRAAEDDKEAAADAEKAILQQQLASQRTQIEDLERKHEHAAQRESEAQQQVAEAQQKYANLENVTNLLKKTCSDNIWAEVLEGAQLQPSNDSDSDSDSSARTVVAPAKTVFFRSEAAYPQASVISALKAHINAREQKHERTTKALKTTTGFVRGLKGVVQEMRNASMESFKSVYSASVYNIWAFDTIKTEVEAWRAKNQAARDQRGLGVSSRQRPLPEWKAIQLPVFMEAEDEEGFVVAGLFTRENVERVKEKGWTVRGVLDKHTLEYGEYDV